MTYELHDYELDAIILDGDQIIFSFPKGFYAEDDHGQPRHPMPTKLVLTIDKGCCTDIPLDSFLEIQKRCRWGWKEISFKQFTKLFKKGNMLVYDEYDSKLTNWKIFQINANTRWSNIELLITDVEDIACL